MKLALEVLKDNLVQEVMLDHKDHLELQANKDRPDLREHLVHVETLDCLAETVCVNQ